jgi:hypothetical protein
MPQHQRHRGRHPQDDRLFAPDQIPLLIRAVADLSYLFTQGYAETAALKLVGDHYQLTRRQRRAVLGASCSDTALASRTERRQSTEQLHGAEIALDGYNQLITAESILSNGILLRGRDGCVRDLASVHGSYRRVEETSDAIHLLGECLHGLQAARVTWLFDAPVSNSGRLRALMQELALAQGWDWDIQLISQVDKTLASSAAVVISSDSWILDRASRWASITGALLHRANAEGRAIDLG